MESRQKPLTIAIIGLGMIGGSIAVGLKRYLSPSPLLLALDRDAASLAAARQQQIVDLVLERPGPELQQADIIFLCTPVLQMESMAAAIAPFLRNGVIVTDVGSTKAWLAPRMKALLPPHARYVGGHPMAGREQSGFQAANGDLLRDKWYLLCPQADTDPSALQSVRELAESLGAKVAVMDAPGHDQCAAVISHAPHIAAAALVNLLDCYPDPQTSLKLAGGGFRDTTRIASSNADMWADICISNDAAILDSLASYQGLLAKFAAAVQNKDRAAIRLFFAAAKAHRDSLLEQADLTLSPEARPD
ncbi:MAG: prephenate dehydrogenase/arogenate dehydrogenase family protein [Sporomusaceae bacterium]|nr:prephenate dehydrogenase/arogenate dehydrogenase family protein [Sporomusaceae bacterium]